MTDKKIRVGIIGANAHYGWARTAHLPALLALPEYELTAVCTAHRETAEESAEHYGAHLPSTITRRWCATPTLIWFPYLFDSLSTTLW